MISTEKPSALAARGIVKRFAGVTALGGVDFDLRAGEVHALVGENGAGKSTLMGVLYGLIEPDAGVLSLRGERVRFRGCADGMRAGIGMVFQHFLLVDRFTVADNVLLGREPSRAGVLDRSAAREAVSSIARRYGFALDPDARVEELGVGARQQVELLKVLERDASVIILDEPTASLSPSQADALFAVIRRLRDEGRAVAFVSHKLREVLDVADRITVLRAGKVVGSMTVAEASVPKLATMMVGRAVELDVRRPPSGPSGPAVLDVRELEAKRDDGAEALAGVTLAARAGEIV
ncbi:MAG TPA: ATP-binding cassette domain-containing protein, partial [Candidatus Eremiobacteraceae bacterium]|nr:ATP-binding cassette domain-containing protein [Candidatus Eremiobacteraceae bacterium]